MMESPSPFLSVIIVTKDRAEALRTISLPSLAKQEIRGFEVIVWDASGDDASRRFVEGFAAKHLDPAVRYFKAPRAGSCAQRNDAVKEARGDIVYFIDDDSEVSPDGIAELRDLFHRRARLSGGCLPLDYKWQDKEKRCIRKTERLKSFLTTAYRTVFYTSPRLSGMYPAFLPSGPAQTDHLWGCNMAFRKDIFRKHRFNEKLQKYSGYALWEDQLFSHRLHREGLLLSIAPKGLVTHRAASSDRGGKPFNKGRIVGYNAGIVWKTTPVQISFVTPARGAAHCG